MKINESMKFFRKNNKQIQKEILPVKNNPNLSTSTLSRFENGKDQLGIREFLEVLDNISINPEELFLFSDTDPQTEQQQYQKLYTDCAKNKDNLELKEKLLEYYSFLNTKHNLTLREFANLLSIKFHFATVWEEVESISQNELNYAYKYLLTRKYYTSYDYSLLLKLSDILDSSKINSLIRNMIPLTDIEKRTTTTKAYAYNSLRNIITQRLYDNDLHGAITYIHLAKEQFQNSDDYRFKIHIVFLEYLTEYIINPEKLEYYSKIVNLMATLQEIGETREIESMQRDLNNLINNKKTTLENSLDKTYRTI